MATDFLANLLDRALERAPVLQRRRPSLFEPLSDTVGLAAMPWGGSAEHGTEEPVTEMASLDVRRTPTVRPTPPAPRWEGTIFPAGSMPESADFDSAPSQATIRPVAPIGSEPRQGVSERTNPPSWSEPALPQSVRVAVAPAEPATPPSVRGEPPPRTIETILEKAVEKSRPAIRPTSQSEEKTERSVIVAPPPSVRGEPSPRLIETIIEREVEKSRPALRPAFQSEERTDGPKVVASPVPPSAQPVMVPTIQRDLNQAREATASARDLPRQREAEATSAKPIQPTAPPALLPVMRPSLPLVRSMPVIGRELVPPAPTIQVTIGRIEVRATPPAAAPARAARPATPKLSLEDYLRSRSGGAQ